MLLTFLVFLLLTAATPALAQSNIILIVVDDIGTDLIDAYGEATAHGITPQIDSMAAAGLLFSNAWVEPACSASRAAIMTGQYGFRTGVGSVSYNLDDSVATLPQRLASAGYESYGAGKWHISDWTPAGGLGADGYSPVEAGFDEFQGTRGNIASDGVSYVDWEKWSQTAGGSPSLSTSHSTYATLDSITQAITWIGTATEPWFIYLPLHSIHAPWTVPADAYHSNAATKANYSPGADNYEDGTGDSDVALAKLETMDTMIGTLMASVTLANTVVFFVGDNGTSDATIVANSVNRGLKGEIYEGGINVPLIAVGAGVTSGTAAGLVHGVDVHATILAIAGLETPRHIDGISLLPILTTPASTVRTNLYTDGLFQVPVTKNRHHGAAVRNSTHKLIRAECGTFTRDYELYDIASDPDESNDLYATAAGADAVAKASLLTAFDTLTGEADDCAAVHMRGSGLGN